jgi:hypothetical protein
MALFKAENRLSPPSVISAIFSAFCVTFLELIKKRSKNNQEQKLIIH